MKRMYFTLSDGKHDKEIEGLRKRLGAYLLVVDEKDAPKEDKDFKRHKIAATVKALLTKHDEVVYLSPYFVPLTDMDKLLEGKEDGVFLVNPKNTRPQAAWDIPPPQYLQNSLFLIRNKEMATWWLDMCFKSAFSVYGNLEWDALNILVYYGDFKSKIITLGK